MEDSLLPVVRSRILRKCTLLLIVLALPSLLAEEEQCIPGVTYHDPITGHCDPCSDICEFTKAQGTQARCDALCQGYKASNGGSRACPENQYYDKHVDRCEPCRSICLHPGSEEDCRAHCPGYKARNGGSRACPENQYYDKHVDRCEPCRSICLHPGSEEDCRAHCPDWTNPSSSTFRPETLNNISFRNASVTAPLQGHHRDRDGGSAMSTWVYVALIGVGTLLVCGLAVLATVLWRPCAQKIKSISHGSRCQKRPFQEQAHPMLQTRGPIVRSGRGPFGSPTDDVV